MSELIQNRQRLPWLWNDTLYSLTPSGREHDKCLKILHDFTNKVGIINLTMVVLNVRLERGDITKNKYSRTSMCDHLS